MVPSLDLLSVAFLHNIAELGDMEGAIDGNTLGVDDNELLGLVLGTADVVNVGIEDGLTDGDVLRTDDGVSLNGKVLGFTDGLELGIIDGNAL